MDVIDPHLSKVEMKIEEKEEGEYYVLYKPILYGKHTINIKFGGQHITKSPFHVNVVSSKKDAIPSKVKAYGPGNNALVLTGSESSYLGRNPPWRITCHSQKLDSQTNGSV